MQGNKGQSLVETVIVLPLILFILFAVISIGFYIYDLTVFTMASNKGLDTRLGVIGNEDIANKDELAEKKAENYAGVSIFIENVRASSKDYPDEKTIKVFVEGDFKCILPFVSEIFKDKFHLRVESTYMYEGT